MSLGGGARQHVSRDAEERRRRPCLAAVAVPFGLGQGRHEALVGDEEGVHERCVDPGEERRIVRAVAGVRDEGAGGPRQLSVHAVMDAIDRCGGGGRFLGCAERQSEHRRQSTLEPSYPTPAVRRKPAVVGHALCHQWMSELKQDGPPPAREQDDLPMEPPRDREAAARPRYGVRFIKEIRHGRFIIPLSPALGRPLAISHRGRYGVSWAGT